MPAWSDELASARTATNLSQRAVAKLNGIAEATYARFETGERTPQREKLLQICRSVQLSDLRTNEVLANAGYDPELVGPIKSLEKYSPGVSSTREALDSYPWVCLLSNEFFEIRAWNVPALQVAELDFGQFERPDQRHFLRLAATKHFRDRLTNWDELIGRMIGFWKESFKDAADASEASAYFARLVNDLNSEAPDVLMKVMGLWATVPAWQTSLRNSHEVVWTVADGTVLKFDTVFRAWNDFDGLMSFDWHPADAATWGWLERQTTSRSALSNDDADAVFENDPPWHELLQSVQHRNGKTWKSIAAATGIKENTIYAYTSNRRRPTRENVMAITAEVESDGDTTNTILRQLGMSPEPSEFARWLCGLPNRMEWGHSQVPLPAFDQMAFENELERLRWPCLIFDEGCQFVGANGAARRAMGLDADDMRHVFRPGTHLVEIVTNVAVRNRMKNWEEAAVVLVPNSIKPFLNPAVVEPPVNAFSGVISDLRRRDPEIVGVLLRLWEAHPESANRVRITFRLDWQSVDHTLLRFHGVIAGWAPSTGYWAIDLHPADASTWDWIAANSP